RPPRLGRGRLPFVRARTARARARRRPCALFDAARGVGGSGHRGTRRADAARPALVRGALARRAPGPAVGAATARRPASRASDGSGPRSGVAEATVSSIEARVEEMSLSREQGLEVVTDLMRERMPDWDWLVAYVFHRQLLAALRRSDLWADPDRQASGTLCVGFADLVGFTA